MFSKFKDFVSRHKKKFIIGGIVVSGTVLLANYAQYKINEWHVRKTKEYLEITRKQQHFESTERICNQTILDLYRSLINAVIKKLSTDELVNSLQTSPPNRVEIWENLKIISFARITATIYGAVILVGILRVQLNLIGGYLFRENNTIPTDFQEKYLSLCERFLNQGLSDMVDNIVDKVTIVVSKFELKHKMSLQNVELLFWSIQSQLSSDLKDPLLQINNLLLSGSRINGTEELFNKILIETTDLLESEELKNICSSNISRSYACLIDSISEYYSPSLKTEGVTIVEIKEGTEFVHPNRTEIPMAKLIPIMKGLITIDKIGESRNFTDNLIQQLMLNDQFKKFGANIYEAFCAEPEVI